MLKVHFTVLSSSLKVKAQTTPGEALVDDRNQTVRTSDAYKMVDPYDNKGLGVVTVQSDDPNKKFLAKVEAEEARAWKFRNPDNTTTDVQVSDDIKIIFHNGTEVNLTLGLMPGLSLEVKPVWYSNGLSYVVNTFMITPTSKYGIYNIAYKDGDDGFAVLAVLDNNRVGKKADSNEAFQFKLKCVGVGYG